MGARRSQIVRRRSRVRGESSSESSVSTRLVWSFSEADGAISMIRGAQDKDDLQLLEVLDLFNEEVSTISCD